MILLFTKGHLSKIQEIKEFGENVGVITFVDCNNSEREWTEKDYKAFKSITRLIGAFTLKAKAIKLS